MKGRYYTIRYQEEGKVKKIEIYAQSPTHAESIFSQSNNATIISCR